MTEIIPFRRRPPSPPIVEPDILPVTIGGIGVPQQPSLPYTHVPVEEPSTALEADIDPPAHGIMNYSELCRCDEGRGSSIPLAAPANASSAQSNIMTLILSANDPLITISATCRSFP